MIYSRCGISTVDSVLHSLTISCEGSIEDNYLALSFAFVG